MKVFLCIVFAALFINGCNAPEETSGSGGKAKQLNLRYAKNFSIYQYPNFKIVEVKNAWRGSQKKHGYVLISENQKLDTNISGYITVKTPVKKIVSLSSVYLPFMDSLGAVDNIVAIDKKIHINNPKVLQKIVKGEITEVSSQANVNIEKLLELEADAVFCFAVGNTDRDNHNKLLNKGIPAILTAGYMETHPLGRAEWIRFVAAFLDKDSLAQKIFNRIDSSYLDLKGLTANVKEKPSVFSGSMYGGSWHVAGGKSFSAQYFSDAGANYLWKEDSTRGGLPLSFEAVLNKAQKADFWLNTTSWKSKQEIISSDQRYGHFAAFQNNKIYNHNKRLNKWGGDDYFETGTTNPHLVLKDMIQIFHPTLLQNQELYFYQPLL